MPLTLRAATMDDADFLFALRNDPDVRAMSRMTQELTLAEHLAFLTKQLLREDCAVYIAELDGVPVGTGRMERAWTALALTMDACMIGYSVTSEQRGRGYGKQIAEQLVGRAKRIGYRAVTCRIRRENLRSIACAARAGVHSIELF